MSTKKSSRLSIAHITGYLVNYVNSFALLLFLVLCLLSFVILNFKFNLYVFIGFIFLILINIYTGIKYKRLFYLNISDKVLVNKQEKRYLKYFEKNYIRNKFMYFVYVLVFIISFYLMTLALNRVFLSVLVADLVCDGMVTLFVRKVFLKKEYEKIETTYDENSNDVIFNRKKIVIKMILKTIFSVGLVTFLYGYYSENFTGALIIGGFVLVILIFRWLINNPLSEFHDYKKKRITTKILNLVLTVLILGVIYVCLIVATPHLMRYIGTVKEVPHKDYKIKFEDNRYKVYKNDQSDFKVLQLSDIHIGGSFTTKSRDIKAMDAVKTLVNETKPDFIIITGDLIYPIAVQSFTWNNRRPLFELCFLMSSFGIPWTFVYGNHDTERLATANLRELENYVLETYKIDNKYYGGGKLLYYNANTSISGRSNMIIELLNKNNKINTVFYLLDSNSYINNNFSDYDFVHEDQVKWYKENILQYGDDVASMMFLHIPLPETKTAIDLYNSGSKEVKYYFGEVNENVCTTKNGSSLFETVKNLGSTKAIFYGHDHYNNISLEYEGVRLTYGMSIDYLASPGISDKQEQRGATLITIKDDSSFNIEQVRLSDIVN